MSLFSNLSAAASPLFRGLTRNTRTVAKNVAKRQPAWKSFFGEEQHQAVDRALEARIKKDFERMRRQGIDPYD